MATEEFVPAYFATKMAEQALSELQSHTVNLVSGTGLNRMPDPDSRIKFSRYVSIYENIANLPIEPGLGIRAAGDNVPFSEQRSLGLNIIHAEAKRRLDESDKSSDGGCQEATGPLDSGHVDAA